MNVLVVRIRVNPEHVQAFVEATLRNHAGSIEEPGNLRFDVLQSVDDPTSFLLYELYRKPEDAAAHRDTPHYQAWRKAVDGWMAEPREGTQWQALAPENPEQWATRR
jgi:autoinducer 2-degrading protein